ncbi:MAG: glycosyltransferase family 4 protein [Actinomycetota bacterium]|nr:glycosyltransferase family 4 protein [Actinomycetota bacterium]
MTSITYIVPRYGDEVVGGAESAARTLAEALAQADVDVRVLTTTARDYSTWAPYYSVGESVINGVRVRRFDVDRERPSNFDRHYRRVLSHPQSADLEESKALIWDQGPDSRELLDAIAKLEEGVVVFYPYLYLPTVEGVMRTALPKIMHPAAHDEPIIDLPIFANVFTAVDGIVYQTRAERSFVERRFKVGHIPSVDLGMGVNEVTPVEEVVSGRVREVAANRFILILGRVDRMKGSQMASSFFTNALENLPSDLRLVFAGPIGEGFEVGERVTLLDRVSEAERQFLLQNCLFLLSPSFQESFGLVILEAWQFGKAVLVNKGCEATSELVVQSGGGALFDDYQSFVAAISVLADGDVLRDRLGGIGKAYGERRYGLDRVIERYVAFVNNIAQTRRD